MYFDSSSVTHADYAKYRTNVNKENYIIIILYNMEYTADEN